MLPLVTTSTRTRRLPQGVAALVAVTIATVLLTLVVAWTVRARQRAAAERDTERRAALETIAQAQAYHFDRTRRYGSLADLVALRLLPEPLRDPATNQPYELYHNPLGDEWCVWAKLEAATLPYLRRDEQTATAISQLPMNLATCKD